MATLSDFTNKIHTKKLSVNYLSEDVEFYVRPIMAEHQEIVLERAGDLFSIYAKQNQSQAVNKSNENIEGDKQVQAVEFVTSMTGEEFKRISTKDRHTALYTICHKNGTLMYKSYTEMTKSMPDNLLNLIVAEIIKNTEDESMEDIEKN